MHSLKKRVAVLLCAALLLGTLPTAALAAGLQNGIPAIDIGRGDTIVHFGGHAWHVLDDGTKNVTATGKGLLTLLAKNTFGTSSFRRSDDSKANQPGWQQYQQHWYEGSFTVPSDYDSSTLMRVLATATDALPPDEAAHIVARDFDPQRDDIGGAPVHGQKLWPLSYDESRNAQILRDTFEPTAMGFYTRTPDADTTVNSISGSSTSKPSLVQSTVDASGIDVRPALHLDPSRVLFTSGAAASSGKSAAAVGGSPVAASAPAGDVKFTFADGSAAPAATLAGTTDGTNAPRLGYSGAKTGSGQFLSCVLEQGGAITHYARLADCAAESSGVFTLRTGALPPGTYALKVFSERVSGNDYSDFASDATSLTLTVDASGNGTVTGCAVDGTLPTVRSVSPSGSNAAANGSIVITFSEAMNSAPGVGSVQLNGGAALAGGAWSAGNTVYTAPYSSLAPSTAYTLSISGFQDAAGNEMAPDNTRLFVTAASPVGGPSYTYRTITDGNASITGSFTNYGALSVKDGALHPAGCAACDAIREQRAAGNLMALYDVSFSGQANGSVSVRLYVGEVFNRQDAEIWHCNRGSLEKATGLVVTGGFVEGTFSDLSPFAVVSAAPLFIQTPDSEVEVPQTGDNTALVWLALLWGALFAAVALKKALRIR